MTNKKEYQREWAKANKEKVSQYHKQWAEKNKDKIKQYRLEHKEEISKSAKKYYEENKEYCLNKMKEYRKNNRERVTKMILNRRKEVSNELKAKGMIWTYLPKTEREKRTCNSLSNKLKISVEEARKLLVSNDWNYKKIVVDNKNE